MKYEVKSNNRKGAHTEAKSNSTKINLLKQANKSMSPLLNKKVLGNQDKKETYGELIRNILAKYQGADCLFEIGENEPKSMYDMAYERNKAAVEQDAQRRLEENN